MDEWTFSVEELTTLGREGSLPPGYLDALHARSRTLHARLTAEIAATVAEANGSVLPGRPTHRLRKTPAASIGWIVNN